MSFSEIQIFRDIPIINNYLSLPPNRDTEKTKITAEDAESAIAGSTIIRLSLGAGKQRGRKCGQQELFRLPAITPNTWYTADPLVFDNTVNQSTTIGLVQSIMYGFDFGTGGNTASFSAGVKNGSVLVAIVSVFTGSDSVDPGVGISASAGWTNLGSKTVHITANNSYLVASVWWKKAAADGDGNSVIFTPSQNASVNITLLEYKGANSAVAFSSNSELGAVSETLSAGPVSINAQGQAVVGGFAFVFYDTTGIITAGSGVSLLQHFDGVGTSDLSLYVVGADTLSPGAITPTVVDSTGPGDNYVAVACALQA